MQKKISRSSWVAVPLSLALAVPPNLIAAMQATPAAQTSPATKAAGGPPPGTNADTGWPRTLAAEDRHSRLVSAPNRKLDRAEENIVGWSAVAYTADWSEGACARHDQDRGAHARSPSTIGLWPWTCGLREYNFKTLSTDQVKALVAGSAGSAIRTSG